MGEIKLPYDNQTKGYITNGSERMCTVSYGDRRSKPARVYKLLECINIANGKLSVKSEFSKLEV